MATYEVEITEGISHLFEAELSYVDDLEPVVSGVGREGALIGSGGGKVEGPVLQGKIRWSMYSGDCAYLLVKEGHEPPPGQHLCTVNPAGIIETQDGAAIWFDARGYGLRGADPAEPHLWQLTMSLRFETDDARYAWLNSTVGVWLGRFDESAGQASYQAYVTDVPHGVEP